MTTGAQNNRNDYRAVLRARRALYDLGASLYGPYAFSLSPHGLMQALAGLRHLLPDSLAYEMRLHRARDRKALLTILRELEKKLAVLHKITFVAEEVA